MKKLIKFINKTNTGNVEFTIMAMSEFDRQYHK